MKHLRPVLNILRIACRHLRPCVSLTKHKTEIRTHTHTQIHAFYVLLSSTCKESHCISEAMRWTGYCIDEDQNKLCCLQLKLHDSKKSRCYKKSDLKVTVLWCGSGVRSLKCEKECRQHTKARVQHGATQVAQSLQVRIQWSLNGYKALHFYCDSWFELSSEFVHYTFLFHYPLKHSRRCSLKGFSFLLLHSVLHKNSVSPECKQSVLWLDDKTHYFQRQGLYFYLGRKRVKVYWAEKILAYFKREC